MPSTRVTMSCLRGCSPSAIAAASPIAYLYRDTEIAELIAAAQGLAGTTGLRPLTYATMLGLLSVTGMRVSEVLNLHRDDVDLTHGVLTVRDSKFRKSRYLPVHESTTQALSRYAGRRDRLCGWRHQATASSCQAD